MKKLGFSALSRRIIPNCRIIRNYGVQAVNVEEAARSQHSRKMRGWQIHSYGDLDELQFSESMKIPAIRSPNELLIKVKAAGVNPIDVHMLGGYGSKLINIMRCNNDGIEFPLTLGREFSGVIAQKGLDSNPNFKLGDQVWGVVPVQRDGCHAEFIVVPDTCVEKLSTLKKLRDLHTFSPQVSLKPKELTSTEAGGILYAGLTAWSGIFLTGGLGGISGVCGRPLTKAQGKRILVLGAAGGVGSAAVQILKAEKASVIASCATDAVPIVQSLGANHVIDYTKKEEIDEFAACGPYEMILDCAGLGSAYANKFGWKFNSYITFSSPLLKNVDQYGVPAGMLKNVADIIESNARSITAKQGIVKWAYFIPSQAGIQYISNLVERKKFLPLIDSTFDFDCATEAYKKVKCGHLRGKVIIDVEK